MSNIELKLLTAAELDSIYSTDLTPSEEVLLAHIAALERQRNDWERLAHTAKANLAEADEQLTALEHQRDELRAALEHEHRLRLAGAECGRYCSVNALLARTASEAT